MFAKTNVNAPGSNKLFKHLRMETYGYDHGKFNYYFTKFVFDKEGEFFSAYYPTFSLERIE